MNSAWACPATPQTALGGQIDTAKGYSRYKPVCDATAKSFVKSQIAKLNGKVKWMEIFNVASDNLRWGNNTPDLDARINFETGRRHFEALLAFGGYRKSGEVAEGENYYIQNYYRQWDGKIARAELFWKKTYTQAVIYGN